jgi:hypothetical protein
MRSPLRLPPLPNIAIPPGPQKDDVAPSPTMASKLKAAI